MNRHPLPSLLLLAAAVPLAAQDGPQTMTIAPKEGAVGNYRSTVTQSQKMSMMGQETTSEIITDLQVQVDEVADDGKVTATATWQRIRGTMGSMMGDMSFDTKNPDESSGPAMLGDLAEALGGMIGVKTQLTFGPDGKLLDKKPLEALAEKVGAGLEGQAKMSVQQMVGTRTLEEQVSVFGTFPSTPLAVGGEWTEKQDVGDRGFGLVREAIYKLVTADDEVVVTKTTGKLVSGPPKDDAGEDDDDPQMQAMRAMMRDAKVSDGVIDGESKVSRKDGLLTASSVGVKMKIEMPNPMGGDEPFVVEVDQKSKLERVTGEADKPAGKDEQTDKQDKDGKTTGK